MATPRRMISPACSRYKPYGPEADTLQGAKRVVNDVQRKALEEVDAIFGRAYEGQPPSWLLRGSVYQRTTNSRHVVYCVRVFCVHGRWRPSEPVPLRKL